MKYSLKKITSIIATILVLALVVDKGQVASSKEMGHFQTNKEALSHLNFAIKAIEKADPNYIGSSCCVSVLEPDFMAIMAFKKTPTLKSIKIMADQGVFYKVDPLFLQATEGAKVNELFFNDTTGKPGSQLAGGLFFDTFQGREYFVGAPYSIEWIKKHFGTKSYFKYLILQVESGFNGLATDSPPTPTPIPVVAPWLALTPQPSMSPSPRVSAKPAPTPSLSARPSR